jgi:hypothetical protein
MLLFRCCSIIMNLWNMVFDLPVATLSTFTATIAAASLFLFAAANSPVLAAKWRNWHSGSSLPYCRRICADTVAVPVFAAA